MKTPRRARAWMLVLIMWMAAPILFAPTTLAAPILFSHPTLAAPSPAAAIIAAPDAASSFTFRLEETPGDSILIPGATSGAISVDARSLAMGEAAAADPYASSSILSNPGGLGLLDLRHAASLAAGFDASTHRMAYRAILPVVTDLVHQVAVSGSWEQDGDGRFSLLDRQPAFFSDMDLATAGIAYAATFKRRFSVGVHQEIHLATLAGRSLRTTTTRIGVMLRPDRNLSYGLTLDGIGRRPGVELLGDGSRLIRTFARPERLEIGGRFVHPLRHDDSRTFTLAMSSRKEFGRGGLLFKGGAELHMLHWLALRAGFLVDTRTDEDGPRAGIGIRSPLFRLDYGIAYSDRRKEYLHQATILLPLELGGRR